MVVILVDHFKWSLVSDFSIVLFFCSLYYRMKILTLLLVSTLKDGEITTPIPCDSDAATLKTAIEALNTTTNIDVVRSDSDLRGGYTWVISFLEDETHLQRGDLPLFNVVSSLGGGAGHTPNITITEIRKGTKKEVQRISITAGGLYVDPASKFVLSFMGESTSSISAQPLGGLTCLGSTFAKQVITTSTEDTIGEGGDNAVSPLTTFKLHYDGYSTSVISANSGSCVDKAEIIKMELRKLPPLYEVSVSGSDSGNNDEGCTWIVDFESVMGNPELLSGKYILYSFI